MPFARLAFLTSMAMIAFAGNSLLCRAALYSGEMDPASFTLARIGAGALALALLVNVRQKQWVIKGSWPSAVALFGYAGCFSFAYIELATGYGALLLFGAVQVTMIGVGLFKGEHINRLQWLGLSMAVTGLIILLAPSTEMTSPLASLGMLCAGLCWGAYSLLGRNTADATATTAGNFLRATPMAIALFCGLLSHITFSSNGLLLAIASGAITSGLGYAIWYQALPYLKASNAATLQLTVPVIATLAGTVFLEEVISMRIAIASLTILGGVALFIRTQKS